ncbi:MAG: flippase-like domain-containing protein [Deltaproteobacteria bacterium]|nr:flippase-like domain-containing protein [Deltaproteobacteria bacterium]
MLRIVGFIIGAGFLAFWVAKIGPLLILDNLIHLKWWSVAVLANSFLWYVCYTKAWKNYFSNLAHSIPFGHLLKIRICGEAVALSTPLGFVAGDPVRITLLQKQLGRETRMESVVVDRALHTLAQLVFVLTGILITFSQSVPIAAGLRWGLVGLYVVFISVIGFFTIELLKGKGVKIVHSLLVRLHLGKWSPRLEKWVGELDVEFSAFAGGKPFALLSSFIYHFAGRILGAVEISLIFLYLDGRPHWILGVILASFTAIVNLLFTFIPGALGILESMYGGFFYFYGLDPAVGVSMQLIRRLRALFWIATGLWLLRRRGPKSPPEVS